MSLQFWRSFWASKVIIHVLFLALVLPMHPAHAQLGAITVAADAVVGSAVGRTIFQALLRKNLVTAGTGAAQYADSGFLATVSSTSLAAGRLLGSPEVAALTTIAGVVTAPTWGAAALFVGAGVVSYGAYQLLRPDPSSPVVVVAHQGLPQPIPSNVPIQPSVIVQDMSHFDKSPVGTFESNYEAYSSVASIPSDVPYYYYTPLPNTTPGADTAKFINVTPAADFVGTKQHYVCWFSSGSWGSCYDPALYIATCSRPSGTPCSLISKTATYDSKYYGRVEEFYSIRIDNPANFYARGFSADGSALGRYVAVRSVRDWVLLNLKYGTIVDTRTVLIKQFDDTVYPWTGTAQFTSGALDVSANALKNPWYIPDPSRPQAGTLPKLAASPALPSGAVSAVTIAALVNYLIKQAASRPDYQGVPVPIGQDFVTPADVVDTGIDISDFLKPAVSSTVSTSTGVVTVPSTVPTVDPSTNTQTVPTSTTPTSSGSGQSDCDKYPNSLGCKDYGSPPAAVPPQLEVTPTGSDILSPIFNLFPSLKGYVFSEPSGECPKPSFDIFGTAIVMESHCTLAETIRPTLQAVMVVAFTIMGGFIILAA